MSQLEDLLQQCTVKITLRGGWGTGFFVAPELILTCAHVVRGAGEQTIQVLWQQTELQTTVEQSIESHDLALLRVTLPRDAQPICVYLDAEIQSRDPLYLFGYPDEGDRQGEPRTFNCDGVTGSGAILFNLGQVRPGMSGSALLNQRTGKVCGMVKFTRDRSIDLGGGAVSTRVVLEQLPQLRDLQQAFHQGNRRWLQCLARTIAPIPVPLASDQPLSSSDSEANPMPPANAIFISYRRSDSHDVTGRIYDRLSEHFGRDVVFKDVHSIPLGVDFRTHLNQGVGNCLVLVAVIGPTWLNVQGTDGKRRLDNPDDWVRAEIETALTRGIPVIPLLVGGAHLPRVDELPEPLKSLAYRNATQARPDPDFHRDLDRLIRSLEEIVGSPKPLIEQEKLSLLQLTVDQRKDLRAALIAAFPGQPQLELMIEDELGESLNQITQGQPNYELAVRDLVKWAEASGKVQLLLEGARRSNPGNPKLQELAKLWLKT